MDLEQLVEGGARMSASWFEGLFGFSETAYDATRNNLEVVGTILRSRVNHRSYAIGTLSTPAVRPGIARPGGAAPRGASWLAQGLQHLRGRETHAYESGAPPCAVLGRLQFNLLEMTGPEVTPEHGISEYVHDKTQGPACALPAGAATVYRNHFAPTVARSAKPALVKSMA